MNKADNLPMSAEIKNVPKKIYLQIDADGEEITDFKELHQVTWCEDKIHKTDLAYILESEISHHINVLAERIADSDVSTYISFCGDGTVKEKVCKDKIREIAKDYINEIQKQ